MRLAVYCVASSSPSSSSADFSFLPRGGSLGRLGRLLLSLGLGVGGRLEALLVLAGARGRGRVQGCEFSRGVARSRRRTRSSARGIASERGRGGGALVGIHARDDRGPRGRLAEAGVRGTDQRGELIDIDAFARSQGSRGSPPRGRRASGRARRRRIGRMPHLLESFSPGNSGYSFASGGAVGSDILTGGFSRTGSGRGVRAWARGSFPWEEGSVPFAWSRRRPSACDLPVAPSASLQTRWGWSMMSQNLARCQREFFSRESHSSCGRNVEASRARRRAHSPRAPDT